MNRMNALPAILCLFMLMGCAAEKKEMPMQYYHDIAMRDAVVDSCVTHGWMPYAVAASAKNFNAADLNSWRYNPSLLQSTAAEVQQSVSIRPPVKADCEHLVVSVLQRQQQQQQDYQQQQLALKQQEVFNQSMQNMQNSMPRTTYCHRSGSHTVCNTY